MPSSLQGLVWSCAPPSAHVTSLKVSSGMTRRGLLLFAAMCLVWGIPYLFIRIAVSELTPATLVFLRTGIAAVVLVPIAVRWGGMGALTSKWRPLISFAGMELGVRLLSLCRPAH